MGRARRMAQDPEQQHSVRPSPGEMALLAVMATTVLAMGLRVVAGSESRLAFLLYDDAYYYFNVAANLVAGAGSTFDGINPTNGYHPLWCWLLLPVYLLVTDPGRALRVIAGIWFLLAAASPVGVWWVLRRRTGAAGALLAAALFGLHPWLALHLRRPNGLETPLFALLILLFAGLYERTVTRSDARNISYLRLIGLGLVLGLVILARVDGGFLAMAAALLLSVYLSRKVGGAAALKGVATLALAAGVVAGPSLVWNTLAFGSPVPISGRVVTAWQEPARRELGAPLGIPFVRQRLAMATHRLPRRLASYAVGGTSAARMVWRSGRVGGILILLVAAGFSAVALARRRRHGPLTGDAVTLLLTFATFHGLAYAAWFWVGGEVIFRLYYFVPQSLAGAAVLGAVLGPALDGLLPGRRRRLAVSAMVTVGMATWVLVVASGHLALVDDTPGKVSRHHIYGWVDTHLPVNAVLGKIGSGRMGYFSGRPAVDLDGLSNDQRFLEALRSDALDRYVALSPITHLVGGRASLKGFDPAHPDRPPLQRVDLGEILYRLAQRHGCALHEVPGAPGRWVVIELGCPPAGRSK